MGQLYRRRLEFVDVEHWHHGVMLPGVVMQRPFYNGERNGKKRKIYIPTRATIMTTVGLVILRDGDCVLTYDDGTRAVYPPELFDLAWEPA